MSFISTRYNEIKLAITLLTRIPIGSIKGEVPAISVTGWVWPIIGLLIGLASGGVYLLGSYLNFPPPISALLSISISILLTGGLHEDGLADVADGFGGGHTKERKLEIMRDSRVGTYGILALIISVGFRVITVACFTEPLVAFSAILLTSAISRTAMILALSFMPVARNDGMGHTASDKSNQKIAYIALGIMSVGMIPIGFVISFSIFVILIISCTLFGWVAIRQIGGQTGDVLGTMQQIAEVTTLLVFLSYLN